MPSLPRDQMYVGIAGSVVALDCRTGNCATDFDRLVAGEYWSDRKRDGQGRSGLDGHSVGEDALVRTDPLLNLYHL